MILQLNHKKLEVYKISSVLVTEIYKLTNKLPSDEKFNMVQQLRRAALSIKLNLAEGCSRKSELERKRFFEIARGSAVEIDATLETARDLGYFKNEDLKDIDKLLNSSFALITKTINSIN